LSPQRYITALKAPPLRPNCGLPAYQPNYGDAQPSPTMVVAAYTHPHNFRSAQPRHHPGGRCLPLMMVWGAQLSLVPESRASLSATTPSFEAKVQTTPYCRGRVAGDEKKKPNDGRTS
jgi:hypothetical protein